MKIAGRRAGSQFRGAEPANHNHIGKRHAHGNNRGENQWSSQCEQAMTLS